MEPKLRQLVLTQRWDAWKKRLERWANRKRCVQRGKGALAGIKVGDEKKLQYVQVRELQRDGTPHIHALLDRYIPWDVASKAWKAVGGGTVDIRLVHPNRVSAYMSKYMVKDDTPLPKGCRKYSSGGGVRLEGVRPAPSAGKWRVQSYTGPGPGVAADGWAEVYDPRAIFGQLQRRRPMPQKLRDDISRAIRQRELEAAAAWAATCSCDGGPRPRVGCCSA